MPEQEKSTKKAKRRNKKAKSVEKNNDDAVLLNMDEDEGDVLDGLFNIVDIEEKQLIKQIPACRKQNQGARCLMKCNIDASLTIKDAIGKLKRKNKSVTKCSSFGKEFIVNNGIYDQHKHTRGIIHRDIILRGYLVCIVFLTTHEKTGGIKFWRGSHDFMGAKLVQGIGDRPKDLPRQLEKEGFEEVTVYPQRGKAVIFDGRLLHQSLHHMGIAQRAVLAFWLAPNESTKLNVNQEQYLHQRLHKTSDN